MNDYFSKNKTKLKSSQGPGEIKRSYNRLILIFFIFFLSINASAQVTEHFSDESVGSTTFTTSGFSFSLTGSYLKVIHAVGYGYTGTASDNDYVDNFGNYPGAAGVLGSITNSTATFKVTDLYVFPGVTGDLVSNAGTIIIRGKLNGSTQFTHTIASVDINTASHINMGWTYVNLSSYSSYSLDQLEFEVTGSLRYLAIDAFKHTSTALPGGTFIATTSNNWATATNWAGGSVPTSATDVTIPSGKTAEIGATTSASCNNLTVTGTLTIQSSSSGTGSLVVSGTSSGSVTCQRYMTGNIWHMVTPIAEGSSVSTFIQAAGNAIALSGSNYGMMDYNETTNVWNSYFTSAVSGNFTAGKGYAVRRSSDGVVTFTGTLTYGTKSLAITKAGSQGWNLIGNPYTSSIYMNTAANGTYNFLKTNAIDASKLDASYACIYLWDVTSGTYKILGNTSYSGRDLNINVFAPGQSFFIKAASAGTVEFNKNMQVNQTGSTFKVPSSTFKAKASTINWPGITLTATNFETSSSAIVTFNGNMTNGLDPTYDAGLLRGTNGLSLFTRLVEDNGVEFAVQCLPENYNNLVIPVGIDSKDGGEIVFSAETFDLPETCNVFLEDRTTQTFTSLAAGTTYKTTIPAGPTAVGRFYIHTGDKTVTPLLKAKIYNLKAYISNNTIIIEGEVSDQAIATLYDLQGQKLRVNTLNKGSLNTISCSELMSGIYMLTIKQKGDTVTRKLIKK